MYFSLNLWLFNHHLSSLLLFPSCALILLYIWSKNHLLLEGWVQWNEKKTVSLSGMVCQHFHLPVRIDQAPLCYTHLSAVVFSAALQFDLRAGHALHHSQTQVHVLHWLVFSQGPLLNTQSKEKQKFIRMHTFTLINALLYRTVHGTVSQNPLLSAYGITALDSAHRRSFHPDNLLDVVLGIFSLGLCSHLASFLLSIVTFLCSCLCVYK